jgi:hypothetical protein
MFGFCADHGDDAVRKLSRDLFSCKDQFVGDIDEYLIDKYPTNGLILTVQGQLAAMSTNCFI